MLASCLYAIIMARYCSHHAIIMFSPCCHQGLLMISHYILTVLCFIYTLLTLSLCCSTDLIVLSQHALFFVTGHVRITSSGLVNHHTQIMLTKKTLTFASTQFTNSSPSHLLACVGITGVTGGMSSGYNISTEICAANRIKPAGEAAQAQQWV
jgi:hypothetical protein